MNVDIKTKLLITQILAQVLADFTGLSSTASQIVSQIVKVRPMQSENSLGHVYTLEFQLFIDQTLKGVALLLQALLVSPVTHEFSQLVNNLGNILLLYHLAGFKE
jgi:hypothetical protein